MFELTAAIFAVYILLAIAFPDRFIPMMAERKKKVGAAYWGVYEGKSTAETEDERKIDAPTAPARKQKMVAGSAMYASGRGISTRR